MRKHVLVLAALALCAVPAAAQQRDAAPLAPATAEATPVPALAPQTTAQSAADPAAALYLSSADAREQVRQSQERRDRAEGREARAMGQRDFLIIAAAVAVGVIVAALLLD